MVRETILRSFPMVRSCHARWVAVVVLIAYTGCDPHAGAPPVESSMEEANVKGTVRVRGKPVNNGTIRFHAANIRRPGATDRTARIERDGTYTTNAFIGPNEVEVTCKELNAPQLRQFRDENPSVLVKSGENTIDIDFPPKPQ
jgi:hypothetical protein